jgi:hypothetical protein
MYTNMFKDPLKFNDNEALMQREVSISIFNVGAARAILEANVVFQRLWLDTPGLEIMVSYNKDALWVNVWGLCIARWSARAGLELIFVPVVSINNQIPPYVQTWQSVKIVGDLEDVYDYLLEKFGWELRWTRSNRWMSQFGVSLIEAGRDSKVMLNRDVLKHVYNKTVPLHYQIDTSDNNIPSFEEQMNEIHSN